jgi:hypothetical protein
MLDIAIDAVAIRLGLWVWHIPIDAGYFGVPAGNFYAWLFVTASFAFVTRHLRSLAATRRRREWWQLAVPVPAYAGLVGALLPYFALRRFVFTGEANGYQIVIAATAVFAILVGRELICGRAVVGRPEWAPSAMRLPIHAYFLVAVFHLGLHHTEPVLLWVAVVMAGGELLLAAACARVVRRQPGQRAVKSATDP